LLVEKKITKRGAASLKTSRFGALKQVKRLAYQKQFHASTRPSDLVDGRA
jgi:hypothetical protein